MNDKVNFRVGDRVLANGGYSFDPIEVVIDKERDGGFIVNTWFYTAGDLGLVTDDAKPEQELRILVDWRNPFHPIFVEVEDLDGNSVGDEVIEWDKTYPGNGVWSLRVKR